MRNFADELTDAVDALLTLVTESGAVVPSLWRLEVANALQMAVRRKQIDAAFRDAALLALRDLPIRVDEPTEQQAWSTTLQLADRHLLTMYDAAYLELAQRLSVPLAALDQELRKAEQANGVPLLGL